jgi:hypothetical protein
MIVKSRLGVEPISFESDAELQRYVHDLVRTRAHVNRSRTGKTNRLWKPPPEIAIHYDPLQHDLYRCKDPECIFPQFPCREGKGKFGEFPLAVARERFRRLGYKVLASEPRLPDEAGFMLVAYPGKRRTGDEAYKRMEAIFGSAILADLNVRVDIATGTADAPRVSALAG